MPTFKDPLKRVPARSSSLSSRPSANSQNNPSGFSLVSAFGRATPLACLLAPGPCLSSLHSDASSRKPSRGATPQPASGALLCFPGCQYSLCYGIPHPGFNTQFQGSPPHPTPPRSSTLNSTRAGLCLSYLLEPVRRGAWHRAGAQSLGI